MNYYKNIGQYCPKCGSQLDEGDVVICPFGSSKIISCGPCATEIERENNTWLTGREWLEAFGIKRR